MLRALVALLAAVIAALAATGDAQAQAFRLTDPLRGSTAMGHPVGGRFDAQGWHVTARTDRLWYALPRLVSGSVEFTISNVSMANLGESDNELFAMYEAGHGITEPIRYAPEFRENHYKCMLRVYGRSETGRVGAQKLMWGMCPAGAPGYGACSCGSSFFEEPFGGAFTWDGSAQRFRIEWGGGRTRLLRNGAVVLTIDWSRSGLAFGPQELHLSLGTSRPSAWADAVLPVGAIFSDVVIEGTIGPLAVCPGSVVPDAGAPADTGTMSSTMVVDVPAIEDVTVEQAFPTRVYPDVNDLSVSHNDSEFYLKFRVGDLPGRIVRARLILNSARDRSAEGHGASVFAAGHAMWSESTLTYSARPGARGGRLARIDGISVDQVYDFALPEGTVTTAGVYAFAVLPETTDTNGAHFDSREVGGGRGPILRLTIDRTMPPLVDAGVDARMDAAGDVATMRDDGPAGSDVVVVDAAGGADAGAMNDGSAGGDARDAAGDARRAPGVSGGCGCRAAGRSGQSEGGRSVGSGAVGIAVAVVVAGARRRRRRV